MEKEKFIKITKLAHELTRVYKKKFNVNYSLQFGIFFKYLCAMMKNKEKIEKSSSIKAEALYRRNEPFYKKIVKKAGKLVTFFCKGSGLDIEYWVEVSNGEKKEFTNHGKNLFDDFLKYDVNVLALMYKHKTAY